MNTHYARRDTNYIARESMSLDLSAAWGSGTASSPKFRRAFDETIDDFRISGKCYSFDTDEGLVAGATTSLTCVIHRPAREVWPYFKDHTLWQDAYHHYYSGVLGDIEGQSFAISVKPNEFGRDRYEVVRVIPEHLIIMQQPIPDDDFSIAPGQAQGGVSPGVMVFMLSEFGDETIVNAFMEHRYRTQELREPEAFEAFFWLPDSLMKWRDVFIPALKMLAYDGEIPEEWKEEWRRAFEKVRDEYEAELDSGDVG
jgi:hypothetical protein